MTTTLSSKQAETIFQELVEHYKRYLGRRMYEGEGNWRKIRGFFLAYATYLPYFGIRNKDNVLIIEFNVENGIDTLLHTAIKHKEYWAEVGVFDKKVECDTKWPTGGHLSIECDYSSDVEKLCAYINEFIYQVQSRIESIIGGSK